MAEYIDKEKLRQAMFQEAFEKDSDLQRWDSGCWIRYKLFENVLEKTKAADVITRDEGIRLGAELAAMHGSDATSQDLEKAYWRGFEDAMQKRDVQPVTHCKDCVYRPYYEPSDSRSVSDLVFPDYRFNPCPCRVEDIWYSWMPDDDWFCAYGKRKDGET